MNKLKLILIGVILFSCTRTADTIEEALTSKDFVRWNKDQQITVDLFEGEGQQNANSIWVGHYFIWDLRTDELKFNVTTFMDKQKSYVAKTNDSIYTALLPFISKLKFDYYEIHARKFRQYLKEHQMEFNYESGETLDSLSLKYSNDAANGWEEIVNQLETRYSKELLKELRDKIDTELNDLKDYDSSINSYY